MNDRTPRRPLTLADIPPDARGVPWRKWYASLPISAFIDPDLLKAYRDREAFIDREVERLENERQAKRTKRPAKVAELPIATPRDSYGWRSLPSGSRRLPS